MFMATRQGVVKNCSEEFANARQRLVAISLRDNDELIDVRLTDGKHQVVLITENGHQFASAKKMPPWDVMLMV